MFENQEKKRLLSRDSMLHNHMFFYFHIEVLFFIHDTSCVISWRFECKLENRLWLNKRELQSFELFYRKPVYVEFVYKLYERFSYYWWHWSAHHRDIWKLTYNMIKVQVAKYFIFFLHQVFIEFLLMYYKINLTYNKIIIF